MESSPFGLPEGTPNVYASKVRKPSSRCPLPSPTKTECIFKGQFQISEREALTSSTFSGLCSALLCSGLTKGYDSTPGETIAFTCLWKLSHMRGSTNLILRGYVLQPSGTSHSSHCLWHQFWVALEAHTAATICSGCFQHRKTYLRGLRGSSSELPLPQVLQSGYSALSTECLSLLPILVYTWSCP